MGNFYFEQVLQTGLAGIDGAGITTAVLQIAGVILIMSLLYGVYEAYSNGGDVRALGVAGIKYLVLGLVFLSYPAVFRSVNGMFSAVADYMYGLNGVGDVFSNWRQDVATYLNQNGSSLWSLVVGAIPGLLGTVLMLIGFVVLPVSYTLFTLAYALYGSVLYVVGPFVLALMPSRSMGGLARTYFVNLMTFQAWGLIYAIIQVLMSAVNLNNAQAVLGAGSVLNSFVGSTQAILLGVVSILFSLSIAIIPFVASRIVRGDVGSTMLLVVAGAAAMAQSALTGARAIGQGRQSTPEGPPPAPSDNASGPGLGSGNQHVPAPGSSGSGPVGSGGALLAQSKPPSMQASSEGGNATSAKDASGGTADSAAGGSGGSPSRRGSSHVLWNPDTGQVFRWNGSGWQGAGHVSNPMESSAVTANGGNYGITQWTGGAPRQSASRAAYTAPPGLAAMAVCSLGTGIGRAMRAVGLGKSV
jgi:hypothetical protein